MAHQLQRTLRTFILILALPAVALAQTDAPFTGQWTMGTLAGDQVLLNIQRMNVNSKMNNVSPVNLSRIRGLSRAQFDSPGSLVRFELVRDAGTIRFDGYIASGGGGGTFTFVPNPNFADRMSSSGYSGLTPEKTFLCAVYDVGVDFARDIQRRKQ